MSPLMKELATQLADKQARDVILDQCGVQVLDSVIWRDTLVLRSVSNVVWETKYLSMRGLLIHHPLIYNLVRLKGSDEATDRPED